MWQRAAGGRALRVAGASAVLEEAKLLLLISIRCLAVALAFATEGINSAAMCDAI